MNKSIIYSAEIFVTIIEECLLPGVNLQRSFRFLRPSFSKAVTILSYDGSSLNITSNISIYMNTDFNCKINIKNVKDANLYTDLIIFGASVNSSAFLAFVNFIYSENYL